MTGKVSIVIPNLNSKVIGQTIASVKAQAYTSGSLEVIVAGPDNHGLVVEDAIVKHVSKDKPLSPAKARNLGAKVTGGDCIVFLDADCIVRADWLEKLLASLDGEAEVVCASMTLAPHSGYWTLCDNVGTFHEYLSTVKKGSRPFLPSFSLAMKRTTWQQSGGFDESFLRPAGEDLDLTIRLKSAGNRLLFEPGARIHHCPDRRSFRSVMRHSFVSGQNSIRVRLKYAEQYRTPSIMRNPVALLLLSPVAATRVVFKMVWDDFTLLRYWHTLPVVFLSKIAWCIGAAGTLRRQGQIGATRGSRAMGSEEVQR